MGRYFIVEGVVWEMEIFQFFGVTGYNNVGTGLLVVIMLAYAIGDYVSNKTKAMLSMIFVTGIIFLVAFLLGLRDDIFVRTRLAPFFAFVMPFILVHMGTLMKVRNLINEWKTVSIAFIGIVGISFGLFFVAGPLIGELMALTAAGPISGGIVATFIVSEAATTQGFAELAVFAALLLVIQNFVGLPVASWCLKIESRRLLKQMHSGVAAETEAEKIDPEIPAYRLFPETPKALRTPFILLFKTFFVGYLAVWVGELTGAIIHPLVLALVFGIVFYELGFLEHDIFTKANAFGYAMFFTLIPIWAGLTAADPAMIMNLIFPIFICFALALVALTITSRILSWILGYSWPISMAISTTCLFGFPATYILSNEVSSAVASNDEEKKYIMNYILPKMLIGGFTTVTIGSVILAGWLASFILAQPAAHAVYNDVQPQYQQVQPYNNGDNEE